MQLHGVPVVLSRGAGSSCVRSTVPYRHPGQHSCSRVAALDPWTVGTAATLAFLPWSGCSQGGFYATGVDGVPGKDCQMMYQPAAAAEARFVERLKAGGMSPGAPATSSIPQQSQAPLSPGGVTSRAADTSSPQAQQLQAPQLQQEPASAAGADGGVTAAPELTAQQLAAAKDLARQILLEEEEQRTKEFVDSAWQSLE